MQKGFTLTEVIVSLVIFVLTFSVVLTAYLFSVKGAQKFEEYQYFENICLDIDKMYDDNGIQGVYTYFGSETKEIYYDGNYQKVATSDKYTLTYTYEEVLTVWIKNNPKNYYVIEALEYGKAKNV